MEIEVVSERDNPLLKRKEVRFKLRYSGSMPKKTEVRKKVISFLKSDKDLTVLDSLNSKFGTHTLDGYVKVYADKESMTVEPEHRLKKNAAAAEEEKPAEEPSAEAPAAEEKPAAEEAPAAEEKVVEEKPAEEAPAEEEKPAEEEAPAAEEKPAEEKKEEGN